MPRLAPLMRHPFTRRVLARAALCLMAAAPPAWAQAPAHPQAECTAENRSRFAELQQEHEALRKEHVLDPVKVSRLRGFEAPLARLRDALRNNARTAAECEQIAALIESESDRLSRLIAPPAEAAPRAPVPPAAAAGLAAPPPPPPPLPPAPSGPSPAELDCLHEAARQFNDTAQRMETARRARGEAAVDDFAPLAQRLNALRAQITAALSGKAAPACEALTRSVTAEREHLDRLAPPPPPPAPVPAPAPPAPVVLAPIVEAPPPPAAAECNRANQQNHAGLLQQFAALVQTGALPPERLGPYRALGQRLAALDAPLARATAADCARHASALGELAAELEGLGRTAPAEPLPAATLADTPVADLRGAMPAGRATDPRAQVCVNDLRLSFRDVQSAANSLAANGGGRAEAKAMLRRLVQNILLQQMVMFGRELIGIEECQALVQVVAELRGQLQQVRQAIAVPVAQAEPPPGQRAPAYQPQPVYAQPMQRQGPDPRLEACRDQARRGQGDVVQQFQGLQRGGRVSQQEFGEFQQINGRMNQVVSSLFSPSAGMGDCQQVLGFLQNAMGAVQRMGQVDPRLESCKGQVRLAWSEAQSAFNVAARSRMTPQKVQELQRAQSRLQQLGQQAQRDFGSYGECQGVASGLQQERNQLQMLVR